VSCNSITDDGCIDITTALLHNTTLYTLLLDHNHIASQGLQALVDCLDVNFTLSTLTTYNNLVNDYRAEVIVSMRKSALHNIVYNHSRAILTTTQPLPASNEASALYSELIHPASHVFNCIKQDIGIYNLSTSMSLSVIPAIENSGRKPPSRLLHAKYMDAVIDETPNESNLQECESVQDFKDMFVKEVGNNV
jgi:hypothetical protein